MIANSRTLASIKKDPVALTCLAIILLYGLTAILAGTGIVAPDYSVTRLDLSFSAPSSEFWFGTDFLGRDVFARAIHGIKIALTVGFFAASISTFIGTSLGALAGFFGGKVDAFVVWLYSVLESIPYILLISAFAFSLGQGIINVYIALGVTGWVKLCRLVRAEVLKQKQMDYVAAATAIGTNPFNKIFFHILPNVRHIVLIEFSLTFVYAIKAEVILSFLGLGVEAGDPSWGAMLSDAKSELGRGVWWNLTAVTVLMFFLILSVNLLSDALRRHLDPKRQEIS